MNVRVKICGITNLEDARVAVQAGADFLGFIFYPPSPRSITPEKAAEIAEQLRSEFIGKMPYLAGVFVNESLPDITRMMNTVGLDLAQLSGEESPDDMKKLAGRAYKAIRPQTLDEAAMMVKRYTLHAPRDDKFPLILVDSYHPNLRGGTGELGVPEIIAGLSELSPRLMMAGGLTPENVAEQVERFRPFGVDVASGVEASKGKKDHAKMRAFIQNVRMVSTERQR